MTVNELGRTNSVVCSPNPSADTLGIHGNARMVSANSGLHCCEGELRFTALTLPTPSGVATKASSASESRPSHNAVSQRGSDFRAVFANANFAKATQSAIVISSSKIRSGSIRLNQIAIQQPLGALDCPRVQRAAAVNGFAGVLLNLVQQCSQLAEQCGLQLTN